MGEGKSTFFVEPLNSYKPFQDLRSFILKGNYICSMVNQILWYTQTDIMFLYIRIQGRLCLAVAKLLEGAGFLSIFRIRPCNSFNQLSSPLYYSFLLYIGKSIGWSLGPFPIILLSCNNHFIPHDMFMLESNA